MSTNPFKNVTRNITDGQDGEAISTSGFIVRSEGNEPIVIDQLYADALAIAWDFTTSNEGKALLVLDCNAGADEPRLFPSVSTKPDGLALGRIIWNAGSGQKVVRKSKKVSSQWDWTVSNTRVVLGNATKNTRGVFLDTVERIATELTGDGTGAKAKVEQALLIADGLVRKQGVIVSGEA